MKFYPRDENGDSIPLPKRKQRMLKIRGLLKLNKYGGKSQNFKRKNNIDDYGSN
jgi:hypothetical protein